MIEGLNFYTEIMFCIIIIIIIRVVSTNVTFPKKQYPIVSLYLHYVAFNRHNSSLITLSSIIENYTRIYLNIPSNLQMQFSQKTKSRL